MPNTDFTKWSWSELERLVYGDGKNFSKIAYNRMENAVTPKQIRQLFVSSLKKGETFNQLVKRIQKLTGQQEYAARRIARTEGTRIENIARQKAAEEYAKKSGKRAKKRWFCTFHNSRDSHISMHNQTTFFDLPFYTPSGLPMMYPGDDRNVGPEEIINCRCRMIVMK